MTPAGLWMDYTSAATNPSYVPALLSTLTDKMGFLERAYSLAFKVIKKCRIFYTSFRASRACKPFACPC